MVPRQESRGLLKLLGIVLVLALVATGIHGVVHADDDCAVCCLEISDPPSEPATVTTLGLAVSGPFLSPAEAPLRILASDESRRGPPNSGCV